VYRFLSILALSLHLAFILWVILGALATRDRKLLSAAHVASLLYAIFIETTVLPCPITRLEKWAQSKAGLPEYEGDFIEHYLEEVVYPDVDYALLMPAAVSVCLFNLGIYAWRWRKSRIRAAAS